MTFVIKSRGLGLVNLTISKRGVVLLWERVPNNSAQRGILVNITHRLYITCHGEMKTRLRDRARTANFRSCWFLKYRRSVPGAQRVRG